MSIRAAVIGFGLLSGCTAAAPVDPPRAGNPSTLQATATATASTPLPAAPPAEDGTFVEVRSNHAMMCGRTERGSLYCWGLTTIPGETGRRTHDRPTRIEGLSNLAGFTILRGGMIVGWDAAGKLSRVAADSPATPFRVVSGIREAQPTAEQTARRSWGVARELTSPIVAGSQECLLSRTGEAFCSTSGGSDAYVSDILLRVPAPPLRSLADHECGVAVDGSVHCWNLETVEREFFGKKIAGYGVVRAPVEGPVEQALLLRARKHGQQICVMRADGKASCDDPGMHRRLEALAEGKRVKRLFQPAQYGLCLTREDGVSRCTSQFEKSPPDREPLYDVLLKVDSSLGVTVYVANICVIGQDHKVRCWGQRRDGRVGDGVPIELGRAEPVPGITGASEISGEDGVVCARFGTERVSCWGAIADRTEVPRRDLKLPEPVDRIEGGAPLCVRGAKTGDWYCRNKAFFFGTLPDDFARLVDARGAPVHDVSLQVDDGYGIAVAKTTGGTGVFAYEGRPQPLKIHWQDSKYYLGSAIFLDLQGGGVLPDGTAVLAEPRNFRGEVSRLPGKYRAVLRTAGCAVNEQGSLVCVGSPDGPKAVLADVVEVDADCVRTKKGEVHCLSRAPQKPGEVAAFRRIEGLPATIVEIARQCGRTGDGGMYCWGSVFDLGVLSPMQMTPVLVAMP